MTALPRTEQVLPIIESSFDHKTILVVGDVMLDRHITGSVSRISPEAPVPVVRVRSRTSTPGGAGNVALNLAGLGCGVRLVGMIGNDAAGSELQADCERVGVDSSACLRREGWPTITKTRIIGGHQQMLRLDEEEVQELTSIDSDALIAASLAAMDGVSVVILSDYAKGVCCEAVCQAIISAASARGIPVLVDPKGRNWQRYRGATAISPNRAELSAIREQQLTSIDAYFAAARSAIAEYELDEMLLTMSEEGMARIGAETDMRVPALAREVFDVSGAGDTSIATYAASIAAGLDGDTALRLANVAAGIVVGKVGTVPVSRDELLVEMLAESERQAASKICTMDQVLQRVALWRARGETMVFTNGCFDILHAGHVSYLAGARALGQRLILGLNSDESVRRLKGPTRPVNPVEQRAAVLAALACVDAVVVFEEDTPLNLITALQPKVLAKGADYSEDQVVGGTEVKSWGGKVALVDLVEGVSTTKIIEKTAR